MQTLRTLGVTLILGMVAAGFGTACSMEADNPREAVASNGSVSLPLTTVTNGTTYRLNNAEFTVTNTGNGTLAASLSSSNDPNETALSAVLVVGSYVIHLESGWSLQRLNSQGIFETVDATLVSANPAPFSILDAQTSSVVYEFSTNGTIIVMGSGVLSVTINVTETGSPGSCTPLGTGCPSGQWCVPGELIGLPASEGTCVPSGTVPPGGSCTGMALECVANSVCASQPEGGTCVQLCPASTIGDTCPGATTICQDVGLIAIGACF